MSRGIVRDYTVADVTALQKRKEELEAVINGEIARRRTAETELFTINEKIQQLGEFSKATAKTKMAETVAKIASLIGECEDLATEAGIEFSLENLGYMTEDEALNNGWSSSNC